MKQRSLIVATLVALLALGSASVAGAATAAKKSTTAGPKLFKWVDKEGKVHYGDQIPPEYADQKKEQINSQGQVLKEIAGAMTPEQRAAADKKKADEVAAKTRSDNDKLLLATYGTAADIERARDERISAMRGQIAMSSTAVATLEKDIARLENQRNHVTDAKGLESIDQRLAAQRGEMTNNQRYVVNRQEEMAQVKAQYDADLKRFRELTATVAPAPEPKK